jgi:ABC-type branched-subunit amino acid transport system substrate-binding protein
MRRLLLLAAACAVLIGCPPDDGSIPTFPELQQTPSATPAVSTTPKETVKACVLLPSSGAARDAGAEMRRGMTIAQAEVAAQSWRTRAVEWIEQDTRSSEAGAVAAYQRCLTEGIRVIVGPVDPSATTALLPVAAAHDAALVIPRIGAAMPTTWAEQLTAVGPPSFDMGYAAAKDAREGRLVKKVGVLHTPGVFGTSLKTSFVQKFESGDGVVVDVRELAPDKPETWASAALELGLAGVDGLFVVGPVDAAIAVADVMNDDPLQQAHVWFIDWAMFPPVATACGEEGYRRAHWVNRLLPRGEFAQTYLARYQSEPEYEAGDGYDAIYVAANAIESADELVPFEIAKAARELKGMTGAFGSASMIQVGDLVYEDAAAWRIYEPRVSEVTAHWVFEPR